MTTKRVVNTKQALSFRTLGILSFLVALSQFLIGGCNDDSSSGYYPSRKKPKATIEATSTVEEGKTVDAFMITLSKVTKKDLEIFYTVGGTATPGVDHSLADGSVVVLAGESTAVISVTAVDDVAIEGADETIEVTLVIGKGYWVADPSTAGTQIIENDFPNTLPVAVEDAYDVDENASLVVSAPGVLDNDADADSDPLTAVEKSAPANGTLVLLADGSFTYTPNAGFYGDDSFTYAAADADGEGNTVTVSITVNRVNDVPVAVDDNYTVKKDGALAVEAAGVLANDTDADNYPVSPLTASQVSSTTNGVLVFNSDGSFTYTPDADFVGIDSFTYLAFDGANYSNEATVTIKVNAKPIANDDVYVLERKVDNIILRPGVLINDTDADGDPLTAILVDPPTAGTIMLDEDGSFLYKADTPGATDAFTYKANDGFEDSNVATVHINPAQ